MWTYLLWRPLENKLKVSKAISPHLKLLYGAIFILIINNLFKLY